MKKSPTLRGLTDISFFVSEEVYVGRALRASRAGVVWPVLDAHTSGDAALSTSTQHIDQVHVTAGDGRSRASPPLYLCFVVPASRDGRRATEQASDVSFVAETRMVAMTPGVVETASERRAGSSAVKITLALVALS